MKLPRTRGINTNRRAYDNHIHVSFLSFTPRLHQHRADGCNLQNHDQPFDDSTTRYLPKLSKYHTKHNFVNFLISIRRFLSSPKNDSKSSRDLSKFESRNFRTIVPSVNSVNSYRFPLSGALKSQHSWPFTTQPRRGLVLRRFHVETEQRIVPSPSQRLSLSYIFIKASKWRCNGVEQPGVMMFRRDHREKFLESSWHRNNNEAVANDQRNAVIIPPRCTGRDCSDTNASTADLYLRATCPLSPIPRFHSLVSTFRLARQLLPSRGD